MVRWGEVVAGYQDQALEVARGAQGTDRVPRGRYRRPEPRKRALHYLQGLLSQVKRKNDSGESGSASRYWAQDCSLSARLRILTPRRCRSWTLPMVYSQRRPMRSRTPQPGCRLEPAGSPENASPAGCLYRRPRRRRRPGRCEKAPRRQSAWRIWAGWCGRSRRPRPSLPSNW